MGGLSNVNCQNWKADEKRPGMGRCAIGVFKNTGLFALCADCDQRVPLDPSAASYVIPLTIGGMPPAALKAMDVVWDKAYQNRLWGGLHDRAADRDRTVPPDPVVETAFITRWRKRILCDDCRAHFDAHYAAHPIDFSTWGSYFQWTVDYHNAVNDRIGSPRLPLVAAQMLWKSGGVTLPHVAMPAVQLPVMTSQVVNAREACKACDQFQGFTSPEAQNVVHCKAKDCVSCRNAVSLVSAVCPLKKWDNANPPAPSPLSEPEDADAGNSEYPSRFAFKLRPIDGGDETIYAMQRSAPGIDEWQANNGKVKIIVKPDPSVGKPLVTVRIADDKDQYYTINRFIDDVTMSGGVENTAFRADFTLAKKKMMGRERNAVMSLAKKRTRVLLKSSLSPGDIVTMTAAVRELHEQHGSDFEINVDTSCAAIWENNPRITAFPHDKADKVIKLDYELIHSSNDVPYHFVHGYAQNLAKQLGIPLPLRKHGGEIFLSEDERRWTSQVEELGHREPFWIITAGGKKDYTAKWWNPSYVQEVIDHFEGRIKFVQIGSNEHWHPPMENVIDLRGKTNLRQMIRLMYHASGGVGLVSFPMHLAAAIPQKPGLPRNKPFVVIAGSREPAQWEQYPHHRYLANNGCLPCAPNGGCWKSKATEIGVDANDANRSSICDNRVALTQYEVDGVGVHVAKCMNMIESRHVVEAIESYYLGGMLAYPNRSQLVNA